jgi:pimeloyl-ACP methyl ester carboxylesterase
MPGKHFSDNRRADLGGWGGVATPASWVFVLLHGGQHDGRCWRHVQKRLHTGSVAPDLPYRHAAGTATPAMSEAVEAICSRIDALSADNVILAGHSMAGLMMPAIANRCPKVRHSVYVAAAALRPGPATLADYLAEEIPFYRLERRILTRWRLSNPGKRLNLFTSRRGLRWFSYYLLTLPRSVGAERRELLLTLGPEPNWQLDIGTQTAPSTDRRTYIYAGRDRVARQYVVDFAKQRLGPNMVVHTIASAGHGLLVSHPGDVATILNEILRLEMASAGCRT